MATATTESPEHLDHTILLQTILAARGGDFSVRLPVDLVGVDGKIADAFNEIMELNAKTVTEVARISRVVGAEGKIAQRAALPSKAEGGWRDMIDSVNTLISAVTAPMVETARVIGAVAKGT